MPQGFGDTFVQSLQFGTKIAQEQDQFQQQRNLAEDKMSQEASQHAQAVAMEERKLAANQVLEGLKMDALNRQITQADKQHAETMKFNYEHDAQEIREKQLTDFNTQFAMITPQQAKDYGIEAVKGSSLQKLYNRLPLGEQANTLYTDTRTMGLIQAMEAQKHVDAIKNAPLVEADTLSAEFDKGNFPQTTITTQTDTGKPSLLKQITSVMGASINNNDIPGATVNFDKNWDPLREEYKDPIVTAWNNIKYAWNKVPNEQVQREIVNTEGIKQFLNEKADVVNKMIPRAKGENFPLYGSSIGTYTNMAESLLQVDENGNVAFDSRGLSPQAAKAALYSIASTHKTGYLNALAEAESQRKATAVTDKDKAEEDYGIAIQNAKKQYPLYKEAIGQAFGQRYTRQ